MLALCQRWSVRFAAAFALGSLAAAALGAEPRIDRPNQYPSPSVAHTAIDGAFDADYPWVENTLTGDWGGWRPELAAQGVVFDIGYVSLLMANTHGGFDTGFVGSGPLGITATIDTEQFCGHEGGTFFVDWEFNHWYNGQFPPGGTFDPTGSFVGVNTNFMDSDVARLNQIAQLYYEQALLEGEALVAFGKMDANVRFASVNAAGAFQNSIAMYTSTLNGFIPTYPNEATALVATVGDPNSLVGQFGWFDGTTAAIDPATGLTGPDTGPRGPRTFFDNQGHWWLVAQADASWHVSETQPGTAGAGVWMQTGRSATRGTNPDGSTPDGVTDIPGWFVQWQQVLWAPSQDIADDGGGVAYFGQVGWSDPHKNAVHWSLMTGFSATGVFTDRPADAVGIMFARSEFTDDPTVYRSIERSGQRGPSGGSETSLETFYLHQMTSWSYIQPGVMWIVTPGGGDPAPLSDAVVVYGLVGVEF
jgi:porin